VIFLFLGLFSFAGAALLLIQFKNNRQAYVILWVTGSLLISVSTFLLAFKDAMPAFFSINIAAGLNIAAYVYFFHACQSLLGNKINFTQLACKAFIFACGFIGMFVVVGHYFSVYYQPSMIALSLAALNFITARSAYRFYRHRPFNLALALAITFLLFGLVWCVRFAMTILYGLGFAYEGGEFNIVTFLIFGILGITRYMAFSGLIASIEWSKKEKLINENHLMKVKLAQKKAERSELQLLSSLNALAKARDNETGNHIIRTQHYVKVLALRLRSDGDYADYLSDADIDLLIKATPLHDIGKIGIPDHILLKRGSLTDEEWTIMKTHTSIGESVLDAVEIERDIESDVITKAIKIAGGHHEKWDGSGYPRGLKGVDIPLEARIMSVADMYDALVSTRPYKTAWEHQDAVDEILKRKGTFFDPLVIDAFVVEQWVFQKISQQYQDS
jgi:HD-GYP domain-containing protein (c-di-GMP phosphodiesterase class II)